MRKDPRILDVAAVIQTDSHKERYLVAFIVIANETRMSSDTPHFAKPDHVTNGNGHGAVDKHPGSRALFETELQAALAKILPPHMIPSYVIVLSDFPRTNTGKTDRKRMTTWNHVLTLDGNQDSVGFGVVAEALYTKSEKAIVDIFQMVLNCKPGSIGLNTRQVEYPLWHIFQSLTVHCLYFLKLF